MLLDSPTYPAAVVAFLRALRARPIADWLAAADRDASRITSAEIMRLHRAVRELGLAPLARAIEDQVRFAGEPRLDDALAARATRTQFAMVLTLAEWAAVALLVHAVERDVLSPAVYLTLTAPFAPFLTSPAP